MLTSEETAARNYLAPPSESPWSWRDDGESIAWDDGPTIAFRPEVEAVLRRLGPRGLPPFGAVLWLLAACRDGEAGMRAVSELTEQFELFQRLLSSSVVMDHVVFVGLTKITALPIELRGSLEAKVTLAELVFEESGTRTTREAAEKILAGMSHGLSNHLVGTRDDSVRTLHQMLSELQALRSGLPRVTPEALTNRRRTGIEQAVLPAALDLKPVQSVRDLLATLRDDPELSGIARLAQHLMVVTQLPRAVSDPEELPMGGVSDITNRGDWDKLLLSELAHDDLTLMARLANNEAMFLRRERPPKPPQRCQAMLVDTGLRMWGVPRVFAAAVALAFAATADRHTLCRTWRLFEEDDVEPVDLTTREGLTELLASLEMSRHPGRALPELLVELDAAAQSEERLPTPLDAVLITTDDVLADREFQQSLAQLPRLTLYLATVNRAGEFRLQVHSARGTKRLREATLSLDELLESRQPAVPLIDKTVDTKLPAILRVRPFPLRLSLPSLPNAFWPAPDHGTISISGNGCLLRWDKHEQGGELLSDQIPKGRLWWPGEADADGTTRAVVGNDNGPFTLITIDGENQVTQQPICEGSQCRITDVVWHRDWLFLFQSSKGEAQTVTVIDSARGTVLSQENECVPWKSRRHGRFFCKMDGWWSLSYDGSKIVKQHVCDFTIEDSVVLAVLEFANHDGPVVYLQDGSFRTLDGKQTLIKSDRTVFPTHVRAVIRSSADRKRVLLCFSESGTGSLVRFQARTTFKIAIGDDWRKVLEQEAFQRMRLKKIRTSFAGVLCDNAGLRLKSFKGEILNLERTGTQMSWVASEVVFAKGVYVSPEQIGSQMSWVASEVNSARPAINFASMKSPGQARYSLSVATFADGSRCVLDSRGMLHCQSSDRSLPEFSLIIVMGDTAGWCADGRTFGRSYFLGDITPVPAAEFWNEIVLPFIQRLS